MLPFMHGRGKHREKRLAELTGKPSAGLFPEPEKRPEVDDAELAKKVARIHRLRDLGRRRED